MALTAEQQRELMLRLANRAAERNIPPERIDAALREWNSRIEAGEDVFSGLISRAREINTARKEFNQPTPEWAPSISQEANRVPGSPSPVIQNRNNARLKAWEYEQEADKYREQGVPLDDIRNASINAQSAAARALIGAGVGAGQLVDPVGSAVGRNQAAQDAAFGTIDRLREGERTRVSRGGGGLLGSLAGGFATLGLGGLTSGQDVLAESGTLPQALAAQAVDTAAVEAGLLAGKLVPNAGTLTRMGAQGAASAATGVGARAAKNEFVPLALRQDPFDPEAVAGDIGGGMAGGLFPNKPRARAPEITPRTGDPATDAGIAATESLMRKPSSPPRDVDFGEVDPSKPFRQGFELPRRDFSTTPRETVDASAFVNEPRKQDDIERAYAQRLQERRALEDAAYAQRDVSDRALYQELPGIEPTEPVRGAAQQDVPRGVPLDADQLSVLRDQLRQREEPAPEAPPSVPQPFSPSFAPDPRNAAYGVKPTELVDAPLPDVAHLNQKPRKITPSADWTYDRTRPLAEQVPPEVRAQVDADNTAARAVVDEQVQVARPFSGAPDSPPPRLLGNLSRQMEDVFNTNNVPYAVRDAYEAGSLRTGDALGAFMDDPDGMYQGADQFKGLVRHLAGLGDQLGGMDSPVVRLDLSDARHADAFERNDKPASAGGFFDRDTNTIYMLTDTPTPSLLVHEVAHAITTRVLDMGSRDKLTGPARQAYTEFSTTFDSLKPQLEKLAGGQTDKAYGLQNLYEYMSEFYSNPRFRESLRAFKLSPENVQGLGLGRLAIAKMRNLYDATVKFVRQSLGLPERAESALDVLFTAQQRFTDAVDPQTAARSRAENSGGPAVPGPRIEEAGIVPRAVADAARIAAVGDGLVPQVRQAKEIASGTRAVGVEKANVIGNVFQRETKNMAAEGRKAFLANIDTAIKNADKPEGLEALKRVEAVSPAFGQVVRDFANGRFDGAMLYRDNILSNPNATAVDKALAQTVYETANSWLHRAYLQNERPELGPLKIKLAEKAAAKIARGAAPFNREKAALGQLEAVKSWARDKFLPTDLSKLNATQLEDLFKFYTNKSVHEVAPLETFGDANPKELRKAFMRGEIEKIMAKNGSPDEAVNQIVNALAGVSTSVPAARYFKNLREGSDVKATREPVPEALRKFWGEIENPVARMMVSTINQASINGQMSALRTLRKEGMGTLFHEGIGHKDATEILEGDKMGPLQGLRTTPNVKSALDSMVQAGVFLGPWTGVFLADPTGRGALAKVGAQAAGTLQKVMTARKYAQVVGNVIGRFVINGAGSVLQAVSNGNVNPVYLAQGIADMPKLINLSKKTSLDPQIAKYLKYGIAEASNIEDTYSPQAKQVLTHLADEGAFLKPDTLPQAIAAGIKAVGARGKDAARLVSEVYGAADLWSKLANFRAEEAFWTDYNAKHGGIEDVPRFVADRINNTNITPRRASPVAKVSDFVGASTFLPYSTEVLRTAYNNLAYGFSDLREGVSKGRPELIAHGAKRVLGTSAAIGLGTKALGAVVSGGLGVLGVAASMMGDDDERRKYLGKSQFGSGSSPMVIKDTSGKEYTLEAGSLNPYDPAAKPITTLIKALGKSDPKEQLDGLKEAQRAFTGMLSQNSAWGLMSRAISGDTPSIAKSNPRYYNAVLEHLVNDGGLSVQDANRAINASQIGTPKGATEAYKGLTEDTDRPIKTLMALGTGVNRFDVAKNIENYDGPKFQADLLKAKRGYSDMLKADFQVREDRVEDAFKGALKNVVEPYAFLKSAVAAAKAQGKSEADVIKSLKLGRVPSRAVRSIVNGESPSVGLILADIQEDIRRDMLRDPSEETSARAIRNRKMLEDLVKKYGSMTIDDAVSDDYGE
jgi:hypothetical protein